MPDNRVKHAKTSQRTLRLSDDIWEQLRCEAFSRRLRTEQQLIAAIIDQHFERKEPSPQEPAPLPEWAEFLAGYREFGALCVPFAREYREPIERVLKKRPTRETEEFWDGEEFLNLHQGYVMVAMAGVKYLERKERESEVVEKLRAEIEDLKLELSHTQERYQFAMSGVPCPTRAEWEEKERQKSLREGRNTRKPEPSPKKTTSRAKKR